MPAGIHALKMEVFGGLYTITRMWANAQRDGRPAEYKGRTLFNGTKLG